MTVLNVVHGENATILRKVCTPITKFDHSLQTLIDNMYETMLAEKGVGIAAPQVGIDARVFIVLLGLDDLKNKEKLVVPMINPVFLKTSTNTTVAEEGCLSLPNQFGMVARSKSVKVEYQDIHKKKQVLHLKGFDARVVQHEMDHLNGILFIDKLVKKVFKPTTNF